MTTVNEKKNSGFRANNLGIIGWLSGGRFGIDRYLYLLQRISGLGILFYFLLHIYVTGVRVSGSEAWESIMSFMDKPIFHIGEYLIFAAFIYHGLNGLRLALTELGFFIGKPARPVYPYRTSLQRQRPLFVALMILAAIFLIVGGADFLALY